MLEIIVLIRYYLSDAILEYMSNEIKQYQNVMITESFMDDNQKLVLEAKIQVLQEAVAGAIIAVIVAIATAIIALLVKSMSMVSTGTAKIKEKITSKKETNEFTDERKKELEDKIRSLIDTLGYTGRNKEKLMDFNKNVLSAEDEFDEAFDTTKEIESFIPMLNSINSSSDVNQIIHILDDFCIDDDEIDEIEARIKSPELINTAIDDEYIKGTIGGGPAKAREYVKQFISSGISNKSIDMSKRMKQKIEYIKDRIDQSGRKALEAINPSNHNNDELYKEAFDKLGSALRYLKVTLSAFKEMCTITIKVEQFRLKYANIVSDYV